MRRLEWMYWDVYLDDDSDVQLIELQGLRFNTPDGADSDDYYFKLRFVVHDMLLAAKLRVDGYELEHAEYFISMVVGR